MSLIKSLIEEEDGEAWYSQSGLVEVHKKPDSDAVVYLRGEVYTVGGLEEIAAEINEAAELLAGFPPTTERDE